MHSIDLKRRRISQSLVGLSGLMLNPSIVAAAVESNTGKFDLSNLHVQATAQAAKLTHGDRVVIKLLLPNGSNANVKPVADEFTQRTGIQIELIETPVDDINTRMFIEARLAQGSYDIALPATFGIPDLAEAGAIARLDEFSQRYEPLQFQNDSLYTIGDYYRGNQYGYQTDGDTYLMFYNHRFLKDPTLQKSFADKYGYKLEVPQTWEQLDAMMAHIHKPAAGRYGGALFRIPTYMLWEWWIRFHAKGFFPLDDNLTPR